MAIEVFKCMNKSNPEYLNEMFTIKKCPYDFCDTSILEGSKSNTTKYGLKSFRNYGTKIWNLLPNNCKSAVSLADFKNMIKSWNGPSCKCSVCSMFLPLSPSGWRGIVITVRAGGRAGGCQTCRTHISVTPWRIFSIRSSVELSRPVVVHCHDHLPICPIWACQWVKNLWNLPQIGSRLCGTHISETAGWIYPT